MNYPELPPDSPYFMQTSGGDTYVFLPLPERGRCFRLPLHEADEFERPVVAAIAKKEWRERSERWEKLWVRQYNKVYDKAEYSARADFFSRMESRSRFLAKQWSAWGYRADEPGTHQELPTGHS